MTAGRFSYIRGTVPITARRAYLFAGGIAPLCTPAREALDEWADLCTFDPVVAYREYPRRELALLRTVVAGFIGASPESVAVLDSASRGNNLAVEMIAAPAGSNVVVDQTTYPSALFPWLLPGKRHVEVRRTEQPEVSAFERLVDERTVAISVSQVANLTGLRHQLRPLADLAHAHGALLLVDAAQSVGAIRVDVTADNVDLLTFGAMKWLLGTPGIGFLYVRPELEDHLVPPHAGPTGTRLDGNTQLAFAPGAARHELSSMNWGGLGASRRAAELLAGVPIGLIEARVLDLSARLIEGLRSRSIEVKTPAEAARRAGIVAFTFTGAGALRARLRERGVDVWAWEKRSLLRADPHVYNDESDVDRLLAEIDAFRDRELSDN